MIYKKINTIQTISFLNIIILPLLITGPLLPEIAMCLGIIIFLFHLYKKKKFNYFNNNFTYFFLIFFLYINLNSLINFNLSSLKSSFFYFRFYLLSMMIAYCIEYNKNFFKYIFKVNIIVIPLLVFDGLVEFFSGYNLLGFKQILKFRVSSFFGDELVFGSYLFRVLPILFISYYFYLNKKLKIENIILFFLFFFIGISISGERTAFYLFIILTLFLLPVFYSFLENINLKAFIFLLLSLIILLVIFFNGAYERNIKSTIGSIVTKNEDKLIKIKPFSYNHEIHYRTAFNIFQNNKIFGVGIKRFRVECKNPENYINQHSCVTHPHNTYMQFLSELGFIGFLFVFIVMLYSFISLFKILIIPKYNFKKNIEIYILYVSLFVFLFPLAPSGNFFNNWLSFFMFYLLGFIYYFKKILQK